ncbi:zinc ribbon domain-containing protein [Candidatus Micrarchaeota archaeon]|nr:zinc ribbon domain-containing protein [Candidatus Micrarchaeota archaeon]
MAEAGFAQKKKQDIMKNIIKCPKCSADNAVGALRCGRCGYSFVKPEEEFTKEEDEKKKCPVCSEDNLKSAKECKYCGYKFHV